MSGMQEDRRGRRVPPAARRRGLRAAVVAIAVLTAGGDAARGQDAAGLRYPLSVATADGGLLVADRQLPGLWRIAGGTASVFFQGQKKFRTPLNAVRAVAVGRDGTVYAADSATRDVHRVAADGTTTPLTGGRIGIPVDVAIAASGDLFVSDLETQSIWRVPAAGGEPAKVVTLAAPRGLFVDGADRLWAVAASGEAPLVRIAADGAVEPVVKTRAFEFPHDVVVIDGPDGPVAFVSDNYARTIWKVAADGAATAWIKGAPLVGPVGLAIEKGDLLVADPQARTIFRVAPDGRPVRVIEPPR
jgi:sugar lactone lactonase YvrE